MKYLQERASSHRYNNPSLKLQTQLLFYKFPVHQNQFAAKISDQQLIIDLSADYDPFSLPGRRKNLLVFANEFLRHLRFYRLHLLHLYAKQPLKQQFHYQQLYGIFFLQLIQQDLHHMSCVLLLLHTYLDCLEMLFWLLLLLSNSYQFLSFCLLSIELCRL